MQIYCLLYIYEVFFFWYCFWSAYFTQFVDSYTIDAHVFKIDSNLIGIDDVGCIVRNVVMTSLNQWTWMKEPAESNKNHFTRYHRRLYALKHIDSVLYVFDTFKMVLINITMSFAISNSCLCEYLHATNRTTKTHIRTPDKRGRIGSIYFVRTLVELLQHLLLVLHQFYSIQY